MISISFYSFLLLCSDLPFLSSFFFSSLALWNRSPCGSLLEAISRLGLEPMKLLPFQFFSMGFDSGSRWWWFVGLIWRHGGEIGECVGWIFGLQFCFDGWWFLLDGCGFASIFFFFLQWVRSATGECLAEILFLQWLVVFVVVGCDFGGWLWLYFGFFLFLFFLQVVVVATVVLWLVVVVAMVGRGCYNGGDG